MIETLTPEQQNLLAVYRDKWLAIGNSCEPCDMERATKAVEYWWAQAKLPKPRVVRCGSLLSGGLTLEILRKLRIKDLASVRASVRASVGDSVRDSVWASVWASVWDSVGASVRAFVGASVGDSVLYCQHDAGWQGWADYMETVLLVDIPQKEKYLQWKSLVESCGMIICRRGWVGVCDRPAELHLDENRILHSADGMAVKYRDGFGVYAWHGVRVDAQTIFFPETLTVEQVDAEVDMERRRVKIERMGVSKYLQQSGAKVLDMDALTIHGSAPRALMVDSKGMKWLCGTDGSTKRCYYMSVPNEATTCAQAHNAICGFDEKKLVMEA